MLSPEAPFADALADVREGHRFFETFGLGPPLIAVALGAAGTYFLVVPRSAALTLEELGVLVLLFASAVACIGHELRRRARRAALVAIDRRVGVYREGRLEAVLSVQDLGAIRASEPISLKGMLGLVFVGIAFLGHGLSEEGGLVARLVALGPGVWLLLLTASFTRGALLCETFHLPGSRTKSLISRLDLDRAGVRSAE